MAVSKRWPQVFLDALAETGQVKAAAEAAGVDRGTAYRKRRGNKEFAEKWDEAVEVGMMGLESEAVRRAKEGSDLLMIFLLKAHNPAKYRDKYEHTISGGEGVKIDVHFDAGVPKEGDT